MDTGIISIIMNILPWQFPGLGILSTIMFIFNLVLFTAFSLFAIVRLFAFSRHVKYESLNSVEEISYQGAPAIAYLTLVAQVVLTCSTAWGFRLTVLSYVLWWIGLVWTVTLCSASVIVLAKRSVTNDRTLSPAIFLPLIAVMTLGTTGGIVTRYGVGISARLAIPIIVTSYMAIGYAFFLSLLYYAIYAHRLLAVGPRHSPPCDVLSPRPRRPLDLADDRHILAGVDHELRLTEQGSTVLQPPQRHTTEPDRLPSTPRGGLDHNPPQQPALGVVLQLAGDRKPLPPPQREPLRRLNPSDGVSAVRTDSGRMRQSHRQRHSSIPRRLQQTVEPRIRR